MSRKNHLHHAVLAAACLLLCLPDLYAQGRTYRLWGNQVSFFLPDGAKVQRISAYDYRIFFPETSLRDTDGNALRNEEVIIGREGSLPLRRTNQRALQRYARQHAGDVDGFQLEEARSSRGRRVDLRYSHDTMNNILPWFLRDRTQLRLYLRGGRAYHAAVSGFQERWDTDELSQLRRVVETFRAR